LIEQPQLQPGETLISTLRHGLTELNRDKRVGGHTDVPLLEEGRRQAEEARANFDGTPYDVVITSPLKRAVETAAIVTGLPPAQMVVELLCIERHFGQMEGLTRPEVEARFPQLVYLQIDHVGYSLNPPSGETFEALRARARQFFERVMGWYSGRRIVISSHQNFLQQLHGFIQGRDPYDSLRTDLLNLELNQFHLGPDGTLIAHRSILLCPDAGKHRSF
jgi:broad specificity phosphatase PhoE